MPKHMLIFVPCEGVQRKKVTKSLGRGGGILGSERRGFLRSMLKITKNSQSRWKLGKQPFRQSQVMDKGMEEWYQRKMHLFRKCVFHLYFIIRWDRVEGRQVRGCFREKDTGVHFTHFSFSPKFRQFSTQEVQQHSWPAHNGHVSWTLGCKCLHWISPRKIRTVGHPTIQPKPKRAWPPNSIKSSEWRTWVTLY